MSINNEWNKVKEFHIKFNHPTSNKPTFIERQRAEKRAKWLIEETEEFLESETIVDQADAMIDLMYFALGTLVEMGIEPEELFDIVHNANMNKLFEDGKPHYDSDGKTIKPKNWKDPKQQLIKAIYEKPRNGN